MDGGKRKTFYANRIRRVAAEHHIAIDGTLKQDTRTVNDFSAYSYKTRVNHMLGFETVVIGTDRNVVGKKVLLTDGKYLYSFRDVYWEQYSNLTWTCPSTRSIRTMKTGGISNFCLLNGDLMKKLSSAWYYSDVQGKPTSYENDL